MAKYAPPGGNRNKKVKTHKSTATMKPQTGEAAARSRRMVGTVAALAFPSARVASAVGKAATRVAAKKYAPTAAKKTTASFIQGRGTRLTSTPPKSTGAGTYSPVKGTKVNLEKTKPGRSPKQQASNVEGVKSRTAARGSALLAKGWVARGYVEDKRNQPKSKKRGK